MELHIQHLQTAKSHLCPGWDVPTAVPSSSTGLGAQYPRSTATFCHGSSSTCTRAIDSWYFSSPKGLVLQTQAGSSTASAPSSPAAHPTAALHSPPRHPSLLTAAPSPAVQQGRLPLITPEPPNEREGENEPSSSSRRHHSSCRQGPRSPACQHPWKSPMNLFFQGFKT